MYIESDVVANKPFAEMIEEYGAQVLEEKEASIEGQRDQEERLKVRSKVKHVFDSLTDPIGPQKVMHCIKIVRKRGKKLEVLENKLADGFHRMSVWMAARKCPFKGITLINHYVDADLSLEEQAKLIHAILSAIDSKKSAKQNFDWIRAALKAAYGKGFISNAYRNGRNATSFFKRDDVVGDHKKPTSTLTKVVKSNLTAHKLVDALYAVAEERNSVQNYFNPGVALAVFRSFVAMANEGFPVSAINAFFINMEAAIIQAVKGKASGTPSKLTKLLIEQAHPDYKANFKAKHRLGSLDSQYNKYAEVMVPVLMDWVNVEIMKSLAAPTTISASSKTAPPKVTGSTKTAKVLAIKGKLK
ncbi:uncharacterized protein NMK_2431 [Novimethylophilus kurashikiensis]|uniref:Uncharacterized protein n=1 Tax=Novimethylophilus kurashikiensis TaxID=1825523 RepID=A0A2R5F9B9_9PROT|nr:hypothetical protein [Novimethylophilus kurashikiensis]GBG14830.1 uncharacterized protein NMK_2431 [Novimethylophilus kurashikiensis]